MTKLNTILHIYSITICMILITYTTINNWPSIQSAQSAQHPHLFKKMCTFNILMMLGKIFNQISNIAPEGGTLFKHYIGPILYQAGSILLILTFITYIVDHLSVKIKAYNRQQCEHDFLRLFSYIFLLLVTEIIQLTYDGIELLNTMLTITLLLIFADIQTERELLLRQQAKRLEESQIDIALSQIQPHFLYNSLITIRQLCDTEPQKARQAILDFSLFIRGNMDSLKSNKLIPFKKELHHVRNYLALEQQRFGARLQVADDIAVQEFGIPVLTLQPIVENAVRHGILKREAGGTVYIRTRETADAYMVVVEDTGIGFQIPAGSDDHSHIGITNVRERLKLMCGGTLDIESVTGKGTAVTITIPKGSDCDGNSGSRR